VLGSLNPTQQLIGLVYQQLVGLMGPVDHALPKRRDGAAVVMLCGLQGAGKTTTCGKLARMVKERGRSPLLVAADLQRPAAIEQLRVLGQQLSVPVYAPPGAKDPVAVCQEGVREAARANADLVILDTAGRLHIDDELMEQLKRIDRKVGPDQVLLVVDGMTGQDAVQSAKAFNDALELDGLIMTKLDGDARGGAALSVKSVTGVPIKFLGVGENLDALEEFHPERLAGRILGQGDVLTLVEQAQQKFDAEELARQQAQLEKGQYTLDDFRGMLAQIKRFGPLQKVMGMIPGMSQLTQMLPDFNAEDDMRRVFGIIDSMTKNERRNPRLIDNSRRRRIAAGAGVEPAEVNQLVKQFDGMSGFMKQMSGKGMVDRFKMVRDLQRQMVANPAGALAAQKKGTGKRLSTAEKAALKKQREKDARRRKRDGK
jgi:signal recognition particle subunit SRP54